eukprot:UN03146
MKIDTIVLDVKYFNEMWKTMDDWPYKEFTTYVLSNFTKEDDDTNNIKFVNISKTPKEDSNNDRQATLEEEDSNKHSIKIYINNRPNRRAKR